MLKFIDNLYYRFYRFITYLGEETIPRYNAVLLMSILAILNFITVVVILMIVSRRIIIVDLPKAYLFVIGLVIIAMNSYIVFAKKRYLDIERRYEKEDRKLRIKNNLKAVSYVIMTILLFICSLLYLNENPIKSR